MSSKPVVCTAIQALFEGELTVKLGNSKSGMADLEVKHYGKQLLKVKAMSNTFPSNLKYDLYKGGTGYDALGNLVQDGVVIGATAPAAQLMLALNGVGSLETRYIVIGEHSFLNLKNPNWGKFMITHCSN
jgi:hypothetical protein